MSERIIYNRRKMEILSRQLTRMAYPDWTEEQCREEAMKEENIQELVRRRMMADLTDKMHSEIGKYLNADGCRSRARRIMDNAPKELYQNINEYIDGEELSDIKFNGITIKEIMTQFEPECSIDFYSVAEFIGEWSKTGYANKDDCRKFFSATLIRFVN